MIIRFFFIFVYCYRKEKIPILLIAKSQPCCKHNKSHDHKDQTWDKYKSCKRQKKSYIAIALHQNNKRHQCSCRLCFSGIVNTITNQGFYRICLHDEVCVELTLEQTEFSDIFSACIHVNISVFVHLGGGLVASTHFEGQCIISALQDTMKKVFMVFLLCLQRIRLLLHLRMIFITPLYQVALNDKTRSQFYYALLSNFTRTNSQKTRPLMLGNMEDKSHQISNSTEDVIYIQDDALTVQVAVPDTKQIETISNHENIVEKMTISECISIQKVHQRFLYCGLMRMMCSFFSEHFVHSEGKEECMVENRHEKVLEKIDTKKENEKNYDNCSSRDNCEQFSDNVVSVLFPSIEIRPEEVVVYPATQQLVLEPLLNKFSMPESTPSKHDTMAVEFLRLCTMHDYPSTNGPSLLRLAQAGFYYEGNGNELVCFSCNFRKGSWNYHDSPREIHQRMSPNCKFLSQSGDGNVPIPREESTQGKFRNS